MKIALYVFLNLLGAHTFMAARRRWVAVAGLSLVIWLTLSTFVTDWWIR